ncbi:hypothetical protein [Micromonospora chalcea]|uniref:hypothetical protein n=1 Tax=Micromonospora chalcea TaxID=1874 RepID=UPI0037A9B87B
MTGQREGRGGRRASSPRAGLDAERFDEAWERVNERGRARHRWAGPALAPAQGCRRATVSA